MASDVVWMDRKTPKICGTCIYIALLGDGECICLKQSSVKNPFLFHISPYNNAKTCLLWQKGCEISQESQKKKLTPEDIKRLSGNKLS